MRHLLRNIYLNVSAFAINSLIGLCVIPLVIRAYGMDGYGLIVLARQLLPVGIIGLFEGGLPEVASRYVATAIAEGNGRLAGRYFGAATLVAAGVGVVLAVCMFVAKDLVITTLGIPTTQADAFGLVVIATAISLPLHFAGGVWRGALEGSDRFDWVRVIEVGGTVVFAVLVVVLPMGGHDFGTLAVGYVAIGNVRAIVYLLLLYVPRSRRFQPCLEMDLRVSRPMLGHAASFLSGKVYSALFNHASTILIALLSTVSVVGAFDAVMRIPRLLKTVSGMFGNALLPYSARMEVVSDGKSARDLIRIGTVLLAALVFPTGIALMVFAPEIISTWLGPEQSDLTPWFVLAMVWPLLLSTVGIGNSMVIARHHAVKRMNRISQVNLVCYFAVAAMLLPLIEWRAFVVALIAASAVSIPLQHTLVRREYGFQDSILASFLPRIVAVGVSVYILKLIVGQSVAFNGYSYLFAAVFAGTVLLYSGAYFFALSGRERSIIKVRLGNLVGGVRQR